MTVVKLNLAVDEPTSMSPANVVTDAETPLIIIVSTGVQAFVPLLKLSAFATDVPVASNSWRRDMASVITWPLMQSPLGHKSILAPDLPNLAPVLIFCLPSLSFGAEKVLV